MTSRCSIFALMIMVSSALAHPEVWLLPRVANVDLIGDQKDLNLAIPKFSTIFRSLTAEGFQCQSPCVLRRGIYQCHNLEEGWRYCSPEKNFANNGRPCKTNSPCKFRTDHYSTCTTVDGERLQCGLKDDQDGPILTGAYNSFCVDKCDGRGYKYNWCHSTHPSGWDYCSTDVGQTSTAAVKCDPGAACIFGPRIFRACEVGTSSWHCSEPAGDLFKRIDGKIAKPDPDPFPLIPATPRPILRPQPTPVRHPVISWTTQNVSPIQPLTYSDGRAIWTWVSSSVKK